MFEDVERILELSKNFRKRIAFADATWDTEMEALRLFESQVKIFETIRDLVKEGKYAEAFILNRTVFENYLLICLILKGTRYVLKYKVPIELGEPVGEAYDKLVKKLRGRKDIVSLKPVQNYKRVEIVHRGLYSKEGDKLTPIYHFVFQRYDPISHWVGKIESIVSKDFSPDITAKWQKKHESLYKTYFGFRNLVRAAVLNGILTDEQQVRIRVHYNFLSAFTHLTKMGFGLSMPYERWKHNHYLLELNLLYILRLLRLYLRLLIEFFSKTQHSIKDVAELGKNLDTVGNRYNYFWFIHNDPTEYDYWNYQTIKAYRARRKREELKGKIPYYKNPYHRLRRQHQTMTELSTRLTYKSPWPRQDSIP